MEEIFVPIAFFSMIVAVTALIVIYRFRARREIQETIRKVVTPGEHLSPEMLQELMAAMNPPLSDLRKGMVFVALGLGVVLFAVVMGQMEADALWPLLGVSAFPFLLGVAYLVLWRLNDRA